MTAIATVKYISNGYTVSGEDLGAQPPVPYSSHYAATLAEVPYWIAQILGVAGAQAQRASGAAELHDANDPLLNRTATVWPLTDVGFITRADASPTLHTPDVEEYCSDMDAVTAAINRIFTTPPAQQARAIEPPSGGAPS